MRKTFIACVLLIGLLAPLAAQDKDKGAPPPTPPEKVEKQETPTRAPARYERDGTSIFVYYLLAGTGAVIILLAVCMPIRRA